MENPQKAMEKKEAIINASDAKARGLDGEKTSMARTLRCAGYSSV